MREQLEEAFRVAGQMLATGQMPKEVFMKCCVALASTWATLGELSKALSLVSQVSEEYVRGTLPSHMESDKEFAQSVVELAIALASAGLVTGDNQEDNLMLSIARSGIA